MWILLRLYVRPNVLGLQVELDSVFLVRCIDYLNSHQELNWRNQDGILQTYLHSLRMLSMIFIYRKILPSYDFLSTYAVSGRMKQKLSAARSILGTDWRTTSGRNRYWAVFGGSRFISGTSSNFVPAYSSLLSLACSIYFGQYPRKISNNYVVLHDNNCVLHSYASRLKFLNLVSLFCVLLVLTSSQPIKST